MTLGEKSFPVKKGDVLSIPQYTIHRIENNTESEPLVFIETQMGICPEDDIERLEDDYGRA